MRMAAARHGPPPSAALRAEGRAMPRPVLVTGATGKTGRALVRLLEENGIAHRAASRSGLPAFDWAEPGTWDAALDGAGAVYLIAPGNVADPYARMIAFLKS